MTAALTFAFSFGNTWAVGLRLGVQPWIAPMVGPAVDLSVVGLLTGIQYAVSHGVGLSQLRPARVLLAFCGLATLALNVTEPLVRGDYGRAAFEVVGPLLLLGWSEVGPALLREIHEASAESATATERTPISGSDSAEASEPSGPSTTPTRARVRPRRHQSDRSRAPSNEELLHSARQIDQDHRSRHGRPISADNLRRELAIGTARARALVGVLRDGDPATALPHG